MIIRSKRHIIMFAVILVIAGAIWVGYGLWASANFLIVRNYSIELDAVETPIKIVVIADLHDHIFEDNNRNLAEKIKEQSPDLIIMAGDMLNADSKDASVPETLIQLLADTAPIYYAMGNQEESYVAAGHSELSSVLTDAGAKVLDNAYVDVEICGNLLRVGGMYDYAFGLDGNNTASKAPEEIRKFLENFQNINRAKVMISHRPDSFIFGDASSYWDIDLVVSGHVHGGQVVIPFLGGLYGMDQGWFPEYVHGTYIKDRLQLFLTSGLGSADEVLPRFNNRPEIAVLTLV